jgi:hypothetical protein
VDGNWPVDVKRLSSVTRLVPALLLVALSISCAEEGTSGGPQGSGRGAAAEEDGEGAVASDAAASGESCVTAFSLKELAERAFAFDGTVVEVTSENDPQLKDDGSGIRPQPRALFEVSEWFAGGSDTTVWVWLQREVVVGDRLLVSGQPRWGGEPLDDAIQWECGFTLEYSDDDASDWRDATS